jgi:hypothetical protein
MENGRGFSPIGEDTVIRVGGPAWRAIEAFKNLGSFAMGFIFGVAVVAALMAYQMYPR